MSRVYISGKSIICSLGNNLKESIEALTRKEIKTTLKPCDPKDLNLQRVYFGIDIELSAEDRFYKIVFDVIEEVKKSSNISDEEFALMPLFIGSTSIHLPLYEDRFSKSVINGEPYFKTIGYDTVASKITAKYGMTGSRYTINTACTSSANALMQATTMIKLGKVKKALVLGIEIYNTLTLCGFESLQLLSKSSCKPFARNRDGIVLGELCSAVILSSEKAKEDDFEYLGGSNICDTTNATGSDEGGEIARLCMGNALDASCVNFDNVVAIKAHGTGSVSNDLAEGRGIRALFGDKIPSICTLKPFIGHTLGGCGVGELVLFLECLRESVLLSTQECWQMDEEIGITPIVADISIGRGVFLLNYFGFGGNSTCIVVSNK